jgi:hypothetical protein
LRTRIRWPDALPDDDTSDEQRRRAEELVALLRRGKPAPASERELLADVAYASALATPQGQRALGDLSEREVLKAHTFACVLADRHGHAIDEPQEVALFEWLLRQAGLTPTEALRARMLGLREKRGAAG